MPTKYLVLRTCGEDGSSTNGFVYPKRGVVKAPDWDPAPVCGKGLHGWLWGEGDGSLGNWLPDARWLVIEVTTYVDLEGKVKFPRGVVKFSGTRLAATTYLAKRAPGRAVIGGTATAGDYGTATAGDYGTTTAGDRGTATAGDYGTATAGDYGTATAGYGGTALAGYGGITTAGYGGTALAGYGGTTLAGYGGTATAGDYGTATAGDRGIALAGYGGTATAGDYGTATAGDRGTALAGDRGTATAGYYGTATAGHYGILNIKYHDGTKDRIAIGYVGEGILPNVPYIVEEGKLVCKTS